MNLAHIAAHAQLEANSWFECSWGDGPFSFSEVIGIVLESSDPVRAARQFHTTDAKSGERVILRDFLIQLQRSKGNAKISDRALILLGNILEPATAR